MGLSSWVGGIAATALLAPANIAATASFPVVRGVVNIPPVIEASDLRSALSRGPIQFVRIVPDLTRPDRGGSDNLRISLADDLTGPRTNAALYPPPTKAQLDALAARLGLTSGMRLVLVSDGHIRDAARAWLVLRWAGIDQVTVLNGGITARRALPRNGMAVPPAARVNAAIALTGGRLPVLDAEGAARFAEGGTLIDARIAPTFTQIGHIPGALNLPAPALVGADGKLLPPAAIRDVLRRAGIRTDRPAAVYGNGGIGAAVVVLALAAVDVPVSFYWASWPDWTADRSRPVSRGPEASSVAAAGSLPAVSAGRPTNTP